MAFNRVKDHQKALRENLDVIKTCFQRIREIIAKYDIQDADIHNFDEIGFQVGVIGFIKAVTRSERCYRPQLVQPGDRE
ncbi:hypothetical protein K3495_g13389 [Podosphaera aphanis]|nr:hypothetical protein K3495_g13389 [Podosphaera aphanis]